jgi:hypothetical protein
MLLMAGDTRGAIKEMNEAFNGEAEFDYVEQRMRNGKLRLKKVAKKRDNTTGRMAHTAKDKELHPIQEDLRDDSMALVAFDPIEKKKLRKDLKQRAKKHVVENLGKNPFANQNTFVTGGGLPRQRKEEDEEDNKSNESDEEEAGFEEDPED